MTNAAEQRGTGCGIAVWKDGGYYCPHVGCVETYSEIVEASRDLLGRFNVNDGWGPVWLRLRDAFRTLDGTAEPLKNSTQASEPGEAQP